MAQRSGTDSIFHWNEQATDRMLVRALWMVYFIGTPSVFAVHKFLVGENSPRIYYWMIGTALCLLVPTLFQRLRWWPGSIKYLGPTSTLAALLVLSFTIHMSASTWAVWLMPALVAALYVQRSIVWLLNILTWLSMAVVGYQFPETLPEQSIAGIAYLSVVAILMGMLIAGIAHKASTLLQRVEDETAARRSALGKLEQAMGGIQDAVGRLVSASAVLNQDAAGALTYLKGDFHRTVRSVVEISRQNEQRVTSANQVIGELSRAIGHIAAGAESNSLQVSTGTGLVQNMATAISNVTQRAETVLDASETAARVAADGTLVMVEMVDGMGRIRTTAETAAAVIEQLGAHSQRIGGIAGTIGQIAEQTNMLALNAAIEAARVGVHGRGFAVVAQEVRKLAERSGAEARSIAQLLGTIQGGIEQAVDAVSLTTREVEAGHGLASRAQIALSQVRDTTWAAADEVREIARETQRLAEASRELVKAFQEIDQVVQSNGASTEQMTAASKEVLRTVGSIGETSRANLTAVENLQTGSKTLQSSLTEITRVSDTLTDLAGRLEQLTR
ncbi:MAG: methyl-accepting chemotaxis protein [Bacillota bacterium]